MTTEIFEPIALNSIQRYVSTDLGNDFLVTLTDRQYLSPDHFLTEAKEFGHVAKRVPYLPKGLKLGTSRIFVSFFWTKELNQGKNNVIFSYFIADGVDLIVPSDLEQIERYRDFASIPEVLLIPEVMLGIEPSRATGRREAGHIYVTSNPSSVKMLLDTQTYSDHITRAEGGLALFKNPIVYTGDYFRNIKHFLPTEYGLPFRFVPPSLDIILQRAKRLVGESVA